MGAVNSREVAAVYQNLARILPAAKNCRTCKGKDAMAVSGRPDFYQRLNQETRPFLEELLNGVHHAVLACHDPDGGGPLLSRIALQFDAEEGLLALLSGLAAHSRALSSDPRAGLLIALPRGRGDPMTHPRLSLQVRAEGAGPDPGRRARWLAGDPKAQVYVDLPDFAFWRMVPTGGLLNAGFGRAFRVTPADMERPPA